MKPMKLADVRKHTGRPPMTYDEANKIAGNQPRTCLRNMAQALSLHTWNNAADDWLRLEAALVVLPHLGRQERH